MARFLQTLKNAGFSLTVWMNLALSLAGFIQALTGVFPPELFPKTAAVLAVLYGISQIVVRIFKTVKPIIPPGPDVVPVTPTFSPALQTFVNLLETTIAYFRDPTVDRAKGELTDEEADIAEALVHKKVSSAFAAAKALAPEPIAEQTKARVPIAVGP